MNKAILVALLSFTFTQFSNSKDAPEAWSQILSGSGSIWQRCIAISPSNPQIMYAGSITTGIWKSTNTGLNWVQVNNGLNALNILAMEVSSSDPNYVYCGTGVGGSSAGIYVTTDGGNNWIQRNSGIIDSAGTQEFVINPTNPAIALVAVWNGTNFNNSVNGVYKTTNGGLSWTPSNAGMGANKNVICLTRNPLNPNTIYCGTTFLVPNPPGIGPTYIYKSYDGGNTWGLFSNGLPAGSTDFNAVRTISVSNLDTSVVVAGVFQNTSNGGAFVSTNGGALWVLRNNGIPNATGANIRSILIKPGSATEFFAGIDYPSGGGVYRTTDAGTTWTDFNGGVMLSNYIVRALAFRVASNTLYAGVSGTSGMGIYEYTFPPVGISDPTLYQPDEFSLSQNYPNPFNPQTTINYSVPVVSNVQLKVYNSAGMEIKTLVNRLMDRGKYSVEFDGTDLPSGIYFYKLTAGDHKFVKKMILVK